MSHVFARLANPTPLPVAPLFVKGPSMVRRCCIMCGIVTLLVAGCEEGSGSAGGGSNQNAKANVSSRSKDSNNSGTSHTKRTVPGPGAFLKSSPFAASPIRTRSSSSATSIDLSPITGNGSSSYGLALASIDGFPFSTDVFSVGGQTYPMLGYNTANVVTIASPEPVTAMLSLMGIGALGMATRRRAV